MQPHWAPWRAAAFARPLPPGPERRIAEGNLDNQLLGCWVVLSPSFILPQGAQELPDVWSHKWECLHFSIFWPSRNHQKSTPPKPYFLGPFFSKPAKMTKKTPKMRVIWGPSWGHFSSFFWVSVFHRFLASFRRKNEKMKK